MIKISGLRLQHWRQFSSVDMELHPRLTIITGSNGAGKSTILGIFSQHFGVSRSYLATPRRKKTGGYLYDPGFHSFDTRSVDGDELDDNYEYWRTDESYPPVGTFVEVGSVTYSNGQSSRLGFHENQSGLEYGLSIESQQSVHGVHISSHRSISAYQTIQQLSLQAMRPSEAYDLYFSEVTRRYSGGHSGLSPLYRMKEALIGMAAFGEGNSHLEPNTQLLEAYRGFVNILRLVLPSEIGFRDLSIRIPDVVLKTHSGDFVLDSSSGGVNAIIELTWQLYLYSLDHEEFIVTIDEPENHLHPSMQRSLLPSLLHAFPNAQFIVATHSPFIVTAVEDSSVYVLSYNGRAPSDDLEALPHRRRVQSLKLDDVNKGGTATDILREVLGVRVTMPEWAQQKIDAIVERFSEQPFNGDTLKEMRAALMADGFGDFYSDALSSLVSRLDQAQ